MYFFFNYIIINGPSFLLYANFISTRKIKIIHIYPQILKEFRKLVIVFFISKTPII